VALSDVWGVCWDGRGEAVKYQIIAGARLSDGARTVEGPCPLTFGTPEQIVFWLAAGAIEPVPAEAVAVLRGTGRAGRK